MLGVRNQRKKNQQRARMQSPQELRLRGVFGGEEARQIRSHQGEDQHRDHAGLGRQRPQPSWPDEKTADEQSRDRDGDQSSEDRRCCEIGAPEAALAGEKSGVEAGGEVIQCHQREGAESPKDECVSQARQRALADYFALEQNLPNEIPYPLAGRAKLEIRVGLSTENSP